MAGHSSKPAQQKQEPYTQQDPLAESSVSIATLTPFLCSVAFPFHSVVTHTGHVHTHCTPRIAHPHRTYGHMNYAMCVTRRKLQSAWHCRGCHLCKGCRKRVNRSVYSVENLRDTNKTSMRIMRSL